MTPSPLTFWQKLNRPLENESRRSCLTTLFGVWAMVAVYAMLHDIYLIQIAPAHFTEYHPPYFKMQPLWFLACCWGAAASISPGLLLGVACYITARLGHRPPLSGRRIAQRVLSVLLVTEGCAIASGVWAGFTDSMLWPEAVYPEKSGPLMITQTIQLTTYLVGFSASGIMLADFIRLRRKPAGPRTAPSGNTAQI